MSSPAVHEMNSAYFDVIFIEQEPSIKYPCSFAIITASNPKDIILPVSENEERNQSLVKSAGKTMRLGPGIIGASRDLKHQEISVIIEGTFDDLMTLGLKSDQNAIFMVQDDNLELINCLSQERYALGSFRKRIKK